MFKPNKAIKKIIILKLSTVTVLKRTILQNIKITENYAPGLRTFRIVIVIFVGCGFRTNWIDKLADVWTNELFYTKFRMLSTGLIKQT